MLCDYKFWFIRRDDDGFITECGVRFYEGEISTLPETVQGETKMVTAYRRTKRLQKKDVKHFKNFKKELSGNDAVIFTDEDFGKIKTDGELNIFLNGQLAKDKNREPIAEQK